MTQRVVVAQVTSAHRADDVRVFRKHAQSLAASGYEVVLVHPRDEGGVHEGVKWIGTGVGSSRLARLLIGGLRTYRAARECGAQVFHFHDPDLIPWALLWELLGGVAIYDVHEDVPLDVYRKEWIPSFLRPVVSGAVAAIERMAARRLSAVVAATPAIARRFPTERTWIVRNFPRRAPSTEPSGLNTVLREPGRFVYAGLLSFDRGLRHMVDAVSAASKTVKARLVLAGPIGTAERAYIEESAAIGLPVEYLGILDAAGVALLLQSAGGGIQYIEPQPQFLEAIPVKVFEYMMAGVPFIVSDFPMWRETFGSYDAGIFVRPNDTAALTAALLCIVADVEASRLMGVRGRAAAESVFLWEVELEQLLACYSEVLEGRP